MSDTQAARAIPMHGKASVEWGTPVEIVEFARHVLGGVIELDPCSSAYWNEYSVKAKSFTNYLPTLDAMSIGADFQPSTMLINPPGGMVKEVWAWAHKAWSQYGWSIFWVGFSLEQLLYLQKQGVMGGAIKRCIPPKRLRFLKPDPNGGPPRPGGSPTHGCYLALMPSILDPVVSEEQVSRFYAGAKKLGAEVF
jgi:hypothetical protein